MERLLVWLLLLNVGRVYADERLDNPQVKSFVESIVNPRVFCSSLSGPFCAIIEEKGGLSDQQISNLHTEIAKLSIKYSKCRFQTFPGKWMDSGGDKYDILHRKVKSVADCEQLCCQHPECNSYTFYKHSICFLRSSVMPPRITNETPVIPSYSGIKLEENMF